MSKIDVKSIVLCAFFCALTCILSMISIPIQPIPITMATVAVYFSGVIMGPKYGTISQLVYLFLVLVGLPFTSKLIGGASVFVGPTAGFLLGYLPMTLVIGLIYYYFKKKYDSSSAKRIGLILSMFVGTLVCYLFGLIWYMIYSLVDIYSAFLVCVLPFLIGDIIKMILVVVCVPKLEQILKIS